jgi:very-short-patch-repair endonuclease
MEALGLDDHRAARLQAFADEQAGVVSRLQLYALGVTRGRVRANVRARRWRRIGTQSISLTTGPLSRPAQEWAAVFEAGPRAFLDGASALIASGLRHFTEPTIRVSVPRGARVRRSPGLDIRQTRRWRPDDVTAAGVPRARPAVAAVRAALWARSDKQAALLLTMAVQQGLVEAEALGRELLSIRRDRRRVLLHAVVLDLLDGVRSLGEAEFARMCRRRGLPKPSRQVLRAGRNGRYYLDVLWDDWAVVVEIDGLQHAWAQNAVSDALRQNDVTLANARVLRLPLLGLRVAADEFFAQIEAALRAAGCPLPGCRRPA